MKVLLGPPIRSEEEAIEARPVPPPPTPSVPVMVGVLKVKAPATFVMVWEMVRPLKVVALLVAKVMAPVCALPPPVCWSERRPVLEMVTFPVAPLTLMPVPAMLESTPVLVTFPAEYARPPEKVVVATHCGTPLFQERTWPPVPEPKRVEEAANARPVPAAFE
jgi:hypothetical protein